MTDVAAAAEAPRESRDQRAIWVMTILGFASGLPNALVVGSLTAWLSNADVQLTTIGIISWIGLAYAFKFLWAPILDWGGPPLLKTVGRRRLWLFFTQTVIVACLFGLTQVDPRTDIGLFAGLAALAAFFSATQDIVIDAWRIEVASDRAPLDILSTRYQLGYRVSAFFGGAIALLMADAWDTPTDLAAGWPMTFTCMAVLMALTLAATALAPEPLLTPPTARDRDGSYDMAAARRRAIAVAPVMIGWGWAAYAIITFMVASLTAQTPPSVAEFQNAQVPWILFATTGFPLVLSFWLSRKLPAIPEADVAPNGIYRVTDILFTRILAPLVDIVSRYWLWAIPILALVMTYRIADSIWGAFANPFYLNILHHSNADVALASKMVGVIATIVGIALGGWALLKLGRMTSLVLGAIVAAITNLLYADLASGAVGVDAFLNVTHIGDLLTWISTGLVGLVHGAGASVLDSVTPGPPLSRLAAAIFAENVAGGFAGAVYVAWLSSIVNKNFAAVQYALLSSLTLLIGVIFRPRIGAYIDAQAAAGGDPGRVQAFYDIFIFATWIGMIAVALCLVEWWRQRSAQATPTS